MKTSKRIMKSFAKYSCTTSNCICQLLKQEATRSTYINFSGCLCQRGNQKLLFTQKLPIYYSTSTNKYSSLPLNLLPLSISMSVVKALQDTAIRMLYFLFSMHSLRLLVAYLGKPASEKWKKPMVLLSSNLF